MQRQCSLAAIAMLLLLVCSACKRPEPPPTEQKPEPQANPLREAMQKPIEQARQAEKALRDSADRQKAAVDPP